MMNETEAQGKQNWSVARWTTAPLRSEVVERFRTTPLMLFTSLTDPAEMCRTFGWMHSVTIDNRNAIYPNGLGAMRRCHFGNGLVLEEEIVGWEPPFRFAYRGIEESHPFGMLGHLGVLQFYSVGSKTEMVWRQYFDHPNLDAMLIQLTANIAMVIDRLHDRFDL